MHFKQIATAVFAFISFLNMSEKFIAYYSVLFVIPSELQINA